MSDIRVLGSAATLRFEGVDDLRGLGGERERESESQRVRESESQRERERDRETERQRDRHFVLIRLFRSLHLQCAWFRAFVFRAYSSNPFKNVIITQRGFRSNFTMLTMHRHRAVYRHPRRFDSKPSRLHRSVMPKHRPNNWSFSIQLGPRGPRSLLRLLNALPGRILPLRKAKTFNVFAQYKVSNHGNRVFCMTMI